MRKVPAFWDASALVPLCVHERVSRQAHSCVRKFALVAWWGSMVEIHGAISRLHRSGVLNDLEKTGALTRLSVLSRSWGEACQSASFFKIVQHSRTMQSGDC